MPKSIALHKYLEISTERFPDRQAVIEPGRAEITYRDLSALADNLRDRLIHSGVKPGDRVGVYLPKSIDSVATIFGILKAGAAYVPVDPGAPFSRNAYILNDCSVKTVVIDHKFVDGFRQEIEQIGDHPNLIILEGTGGGKYLEETLKSLDESDPCQKSKSIESASDDLAYILYTSGSTGKPKGVMLSHLNATSFVDWCSGVFNPGESDRFSSHAPFHFDLSILDIYTSIKHGATLVLIDEGTGKDPLGLAELISEMKITIWYSTPSILSLLAQYGKLERGDLSALRIILFAGEVFPIKHLQLLHSFIPDPEYYNLYGPTETNVCTYYHLPKQIPLERTEPFPIGEACAHVETNIFDEHGNPVSPGEEGELCVSGDGVMLGYWNLPDKTAKAFFDDGSGKSWYKTGDIVIEEEGGNYIFLGRRDRMVKKRGFRIELGEIESILYRHPSVEEAAVIALMDEDSGVKIKSFLSCRESNRPSIIALKKFCTENLPNYMVPDLFSFLDSLPKTSTDKIDYQRLKAIG